MIENWGRRKTVMLTLLCHTTIKKINSRKKPTQFHPTLKLIREISS
jgi:hypothetical protein